MLAVASSRVRGTSRAGGTRRLSGAASSRPMVKATQNVAVAPAAVSALEPATSMRYVAAQLATPVSAPT
jgi:hypothetical protein